MLARTKIKTIDKNEITQITSSRKRFLNEYLDLKNIKQIARYNKSPEDTRNAEYFSQKTEPKSIPDKQELTMAGP